MLRRLSFAVWAGEYNQYVGALQGLLIERVVAGFKYGLGVEKADDARWMVQESLSGEEGGAGRRQWGRRDGGRGEEASGADPCGVGPTGLL